MLIGQSWISENGQRPKGMCESAWGSMLEFVEDLATGKGRPVSYRTMFHKSKKFYDRKRMKKAGFTNDDQSFLYLP